MNGIINEITMKFQETKDEFIFQVLSDFAVRSLFWMNYRLNMVCQRLKF